jgi:hypothetical protein
MNRQNGHVHKKVSPKLNSALAQEAGIAAACNRANRLLTGFLLDSSPSNLYYLRQLSTKAYVSAKNIWLGAPQKKYGSSINSLHVRLRHK